MAGVLALTEKVLRVHACGRLIEMSPEASSSLPLLRRDLVAQLNVCNPASLQLTDTTGKVVQTDKDLQDAQREGKHPLQAKLTVAALHEIEQKKTEGRSKEQNLLSLQWQVVIEQVAAFSYELASVQGMMQSIRDDTAKAVKDFESQEAIRRQQLLAAVSDESTERKVCQTDLLTKMDALMQMMIAEQNAREVADYQLAKQTEQVAQDYHADRNTRAGELAEHDRKVQAVRQEFEMERYQSAESWNRNVDMLQRLDQRIEDQSVAHFAHQQRLTAQEADGEKLRSYVTQLDSTVTKTHSDTRAHLTRHGEELEKGLKNVGTNHQADLERHKKEHETTWQNHATRVQRVRDEAIKGQTELADRTKVLEMRCAQTEKELIDRHETEDTKHRVFLDKVHHATTHLENMQMSSETVEAVLAQHGLKLEEMVERVRTVECTLDHTVGTDHWKAQVEGMAAMSQKQDSKITALEREIHARFSQEATHREDMKHHLHATMKSCVDKLTSDKGEESRKARDISPQRMRISNDVELSPAGFRPEVHEFAISTHPIGMHQGPSQLSSINTPKAGQGEPMAQVQPTQQAWRQERTSMRSQTPPPYVVWGGMSLSQQQQQQQQQGLRTVPMNGYGS